MSILPKMSYRFMVSWLGFARNGKDYLLTQWNYKNLWLAKTTLERINTVGDLTLLMSKLKQSSMLVKQNTATYQLNWSKQETQCQMLWRVWGVRTHSFLEEYEIAQTSLEDSDLENRLLSHHLVITLLGVYSRELKLCPHKTLNTSVYHQLQLLRQGSDILWYRQQARPWW